MSAAREQRQARKANGLFVFGCLSLFALLSLFLLASFTIFFSLSLSFCIQSLSAVSLSTSCTDCPAGTCHMNDEYSHTLAHVFTRHSHRQSVDCSSRRASLLYETNLEQLTEEVESGERGVERRESLPFDSCHNSIHCLPKVYLKYTFHYHIVPYFPMNTLHNQSFFYCFASLIKSQKQLQGGAREGRGYVWL